MPYELSSIIPLGPGREGDPLSQSKGNSISRRLLPSGSKIWHDILTLVAVVKINMAL